MTDDVVIRAEGLGKKYRIGHHLIYLIGKFHDNRFTRPVRRSAIRWMATHRAPRRILNHYYRGLSFQAKSRFHSRYSKIFRPGGSVSPGQWTIDFLDHVIHLPLRPSLSWLDWDYALSVLGHDAEIKETYAALIESDQRPALFIDVGANYGTHSILFSVVGIPIIAIEPNAECRSQFEAVHELNQLKGRWVPAALGKQAGEIDLVYPGRQTWLGSTSKSVASRLNPLPLVVTRVPVTVLDDYCDEMPDGEILLKLDVEGSEVEVLQGASQLLRSRAPKIIFESNENAVRPELLELLEGFGYSVYPLPWRPSENTRPLRRDEFLQNRATNFLAIGHLS